MTHWGWVEWAGTGDSALTVHQSCVRSLGDRTPEKHRSGERADDNVPGRQRLQARDPTLGETALRASVLDFSLQDQKYKWLIIQAS